MKTTYISYGDEARHAATVFKTYGGVLQRNAIVLADVPDKLYKVNWNIPQHLMPKPEPEYVANYNDDVFMDRPLDDILGDSFAPPCFE